jgi:hypothetical protein
MESLCVGVHMSVGGEQQYSNLKEFSIQLHQEGLQQLSVRISDRAGSI